MKLNELPVSTEALSEYTKVLIQRLSNMRYVVERGSSPGECTMAEIVMVEGKVDALMMMMEDSGMDFSKFNEYLTKAFKSGHATAVNLNHQMRAQRHGKS